MLEIQDLSKNYGKNKAVKHVTFTIIRTDRWGSCLGRTALENPPLSRASQDFSVIRG